MTDNITDIAAKRFEKEWERMEQEFRDAMSRAPYVVRWNEQEEAS